MLDLSTWSDNWAWGLPLIVLTMVTHVCGLGLIYERVVHLLGGAVERRDFLPKSAMVMSVAALLATLPHGLEAILWGVAYLFLGALSDFRVAMPVCSLATHGCFGGAQRDAALRTDHAFLFAMIQSVWPVGNRLRRRT